MDPRQPDPAAGGEPRHHPEAPETVVPAADTSVSPFADTVTAEAAPPAPPARPAKRQIKIIRRRPDIRRQRRVLFRLFQRNADLIIVARKIAAQSDDRIQIVIAEISGVGGRRWPAAVRMLRT